MEKNNFKERLKDFKFLARKGVVVLAFGILVASFGSSREQKNTDLNFLEKTEIPKNKNQENLITTITTDSVLIDSLNYEERVVGNKGGDVFIDGEIFSKTKDREVLILENKDGVLVEEAEAVEEKSQKGTNFVDKKDSTKDTGVKPKSKPKELPKFDIEASSKARFFLDNFQIVLDKRKSSPVVNYLKERIGDYKDHLCTSVGQIPILKDKHSDFINSLEEEGYFVFNEDSENLEIKKNLKISTALLVLDLLEKKHLEGMFRIKTLHSIFMSESEKEVITKKINKRVKLIPKGLSSIEKEQILLKIVFEESDYIARGFYKVYYDVPSENKESMLAKEMTAIFKDNPSLGPLLKDFISSLAKK